MSERLKLTDGFVASDRAIPKQGRIEFRDTAVPGLRLRCSEDGYRSFVLCCRFPGSRHATRRTLGRFPIMSLAKARSKAMQWLIQISEHGVDPGESLRERQRAAALAKQREANLLVEHVIEAFIARKDFDKLSRPMVVAKLIRTEFKDRWQGRYIDQLTRGDCTAAIEEIAKRSEASAHVSYSHLRRILNWCVSTGRLTNSPLASLKPTDLIGAKVQRDRVLEDHEIRAIWFACDQIGHPFGNIIRMLFYTGVRLREASDLRWDELDTAERVITLPKDKMKAGSVFEIPYADAVADLLAAIPQKGPYVFSMTGKSPYRGFHKAKERLDAIAGVTGWRLHDIRRTCRTNWGPIAEVPDMIKELCLDHHQSTLHRTYDRFTYRDPKRQLLTLWQARLTNIIQGG